MAEEKNLEDFEKDALEESKDDGKGAALSKTRNDGKSSKKPNEPSKETLEEKGHSKEQTSEDEKHPSSSPQRAVLNTVQKAAQATKNTMNKVVKVQHKKPPSESGGKERADTKKEESDAGSSESGSRVFQALTGGLSRKAQKKPSSESGGSEHADVKKEEADAGSSESGSRVLQALTTFSKKVPGKKKKKNVKILTEEPSTETESNPSVEKRIQFKPDSLATPVASQKDASTRDKKMVQVGPVCSFLLRDSTILVGTSLTVAAFPTVWFWESVVQNQIPLPVSIAWMFAAFVIGRELERVHGSGQVLPMVVSETDDVAVPTDFRKAKSSHKLIAEDMEEIRPEEQHSLFKKATESLKIKFRMSGQRDVEKPQKKKFWTNLKRSKSRDEKHWEQNIHANFKLYRDPSVSRMSVISPEMKPPLDSDDSIVVPTDSIGSFDLSGMMAETLGDYVVEPMLELRGMDVFVAGEDGAEDSMGDHPFLIESGLRNKKTLLVNVMLQWANALIYFELPEWFDDFDNVVENEDDPDEVKAFKRFINGDDEYRNQRLKIVPALVDGPRIIKLLSPPVKELTVATPILPVSWRKRNTKRKPDGTTRLPMLEVELDCMSNKAMRGMANIIKRNISGIVLDIAVIIEKPDLATEEEPSACLGMWRFDRVDVETCPMLPAREKPEIQAIRRASVIAGLSPSKITNIAEEAGLGLTSEEMREITAVS